MSNNRDNKRIGELLRNARLSRGLCMEIMAYTAHMDVSELLSYETGQREIPEEVLDVLAHKLGLSIEYFTTPMYMDDMDMRFDGYND